MLETFLATLTPLFGLFIYMGIGFTLTKTRVLPKEASSVLSKLVVWVFSPALCFITMAKNCTPDTMEQNATFLIISCSGLAIALTLSYFLTPLFAKKGTYEANIYRYALTFANCGYVGDPLVMAIFGDEVLFCYKIFTLPLTIIIYTWGLCILTPKGQGPRNPVLKLINPSNVAITLGIIVGLSGAGTHLPVVITSTFEALKNCMGPVVMISGGCAVARYSIPKMLKNHKNYLASGLRLVVLPCIIISLLYLIKTGIGAIFGYYIGNEVLHLALFAFAAPLGLNTVVFPESFGGDAEPGAGMALVSHTLCVLTIPTLFAILTLIFGQYPI